MGSTGNGPADTNSNGQLERGLGLKEAVALNMIEIVGIGPFVVSSLVIKAMGGPQAMLAWVAGAAIATLDAFVWSELGAAMPKAGGTYVFLREAYGAGKWGRLMSFLFVWQTFLHVPLSVASASIGFAEYAKYLHPLTTWEAKAISGGLVLVLIVLLYRRITTIGKISVLLWVGVIGTMLWLIWGGLTHFDRKIAFDFPPGAFNLNALWFAALGAAMVNTVYSYWGYYNICHLGGEIKAARKKYSARDFSFGAGNCGAVSADAVEHFGRGALARGRRIEISGESFCGKIVRGNGGEVCDGDDFVGGAGECVFSFTGGFARALFGRD